MNKVYLLFLFIFLSCNKSINNSDHKTIMDSDSIEGLTKKNVNKEYSTDCSNIDSINMQTAYYNGTKFYTENRLRGKGVIQLTIDQNLEILNSDKTHFGSISLINNEMGEGNYQLSLPKIIIAREVMPNDEYRVFDFDSELPETDKDFLIIYINKEKKKIKKFNTKYKFLSWDDYVKSAYIELDEKDHELYKVLIIKKDSLKIKSIPKSDCDYVELYKNTIKWVKWKDNNCKLVNFKFCY